MDHITQLYQNRAKVLQEEINNIIKKLGNPRRVKIRRGMKKK